MTMTLPLSHLSHCESHHYLFYDGVNCSAIETVPCVANAAVHCTVWLDVEIPSKIPSTNCMDGDSQETEAGFRMRFIELLFSVFLFDEFLISALRKRL